MHNSPKLEMKKIRKQTGYVNINLNVNLKFHLKLIPVIFNAERL